MHATWIDSVRFSLHRPLPSEHWSAQTRPGMHFLEVPTATLRVRIAGCGSTPIVFVTDGLHVIEHYDTLFRLLSPYLRVVCFEAPGIGFSRPKRGFRFTREAQVRTVVDLLSTVALGPCVLAFSCAAVYVALKVATEHPHLVEKLLLIQAPSWREEVQWVKRSIDPKRVLTTPVVGQVVLALQNQSFVARQWYRVALDTPEFMTTFLHPCQQAFDHGASFCLSSLLQGLFSREEPPFSSPRHPALVLWGGSDRSHRHTDKYSILRSVPGAITTAFATAGHFPELEEPQRFLETLRDFDVMHG